jgi:hypothetical protein
MDASEMRRKAAACRLFADAAVGPTAKQEWLSAAEQWDALAKEVEAWQARRGDLDGSDDEADNFGRRPS